VGGEVAISAREKVCLPNRSMFAKSGKHTLEDFGHPIAARPCQKSMFASLLHNIVVSAISVIGSHDRFCQNCPSYEQQ
jgi:hypothetical protein